MEIRGIDVSRHNGTVDWAKVKAAGARFALIRAGWGGDIASQDDPTFEANVAGCEAQGLDWGAYLYSYAMSHADAESEAAHILRLLKGKNPTYPIIIDMEDTDGWKAARGGNKPQMNTDIIKIVCSRLEEAGYYAMWYANLDWCRNYIYTDQITAYDFWYARPGISAPDRECGIWQDGIGSTNSSWPGANNGSGHCDTDIAYKDYPALIRAAGLNGWGSDTPSPAPQPTPEPEPAPVDRTYTVQPGDSFWKIAQEQMGSGTKYAELAAYNGLDPSATIYAGQVLKIPGGSAPAPAPAPTMRVGAQVQYSGPLYTDSYGGGKGKTVSGTYTVSRVIEGRKCGVLLNGGLGWVSAGSCTVVG